MTWYGCWSALAEYSSSKLAPRSSEYSSSKLAPRSSNKNKIYYLDSSKNQFVYVCTEYRDIFRENLKFLPVGGTWILWLDCLKNTYFFFGGFPNKKLEGRRESIKLKKYINICNLCYLEA